ncbi:MAG: hypothetical protein Q6366_006990 [Candidatus Freyarchaeota archaeon]
MGEDSGRRWIPLCGGSVVASTLTVLVTFILSVALYTSSPVMPVYPKFLPVKLTFPCLNVGYSPFWQYISELGMGPTAQIFNAGMIAAGFLGLPAAPAIRRVLDGSFIVTSGSLSWLLGAVAMVGLGLFPMTPAFFIVNPHGLVSPFIGLSLAAAFLGYSLARSMDNPLLKAYGWMGLGVLVMGVVLGATRNPLLEWVAAIIMVVFFIIFGVQILLKAKK